MITERITYPELMSSPPSKRIETLKGLAKRSEQLVRVEIQTAHNGKYSEVTIAWDSDSSEIVGELYAVHPRRRIGPCRTMNSVFGF